VVVFKTADALKHVQSVWKGRCKGNLPCKYCGALEQSPCLQQLTGSLTFVSASGNEVNNSLVTCWIHIAYMEDEMNRYFKELTDHIR
jgi:hypothetical protein